jgi:hypothetical protein
MLQGEGYNDFPFTQNVLTVTASGTGTYSSYSSTYTFCDVTTKANSIYLGGSGVAIYTSTFSSGVNDIVCNITAANSTVFGCGRLQKHPGCRTQSFAEKRYAALLQHVPQLAE